MGQQVIETWLLQDFDEIYGMLCCVTGKAVRLRSIE